MGYARRVVPWLRGIYERSLAREISEAPKHVAVIQDGNRRYARRRGADASDGHRSGAKTTERLLEWCQNVGVEEVTVYAFSTENFERPRDEREALFDLLCEKLREFADAERVHENEVCIRALGDIGRLPERVRRAVRYAEGRTREYDRFRLNIALAYGGRNELLEAARHVARDVHQGTLSPDEIDVETIEDRLYGRPVRDVDLIIRTGGDERTSNFLPWYANGNEAAVFFCTPYWPEFSRGDFYRGIRTWEHREKAWEQTRTRRALTLIRSIEGAELPRARSIVERVRSPVRIAEGRDPIEEAGPEEQRAD